MQTKFQRLGTVATAVFTVLVFGACEDGELADLPTALTASGDLVPFKIGPQVGSFFGVPFGDPRIPPGTPTENCPVGPGGFPNGGGISISEYTANGRHMGRVTIRQTQCLIQFFPDTDPPLASFDLNWTITTANGDQVFVHNDFLPFFAPETTPPGEIVGGTGRFEGATGWVLPNLDSPLVVVPDDPNDPFVLSGTFTGGGWIGEISTVGSNRGR